MNTYTAVSRLVAAILPAVTLPCVLLANDPSPSGSAPTPQVAAIVNGDPLYLGEVDVMYNPLVKNRASLATSRTKADVLRQLINRRLVESMLRREGHVTDQDIEKGVAKVKAQADAQKLTLEQFSARRGVGLEALYHGLAWQIGWDRYVKANLNASLEEFFKEHHKEYDGTEVRVSHVLLRAERPSETIPQLVEQAKKIRAEIESGKITFEKAVEKYSAGPSRHQGGDLGFIGRFAAMTEDFARVAFELDKDEISEPVVTAFGVHLIRVTEIKPGTKQWTETINQIQNPAAVYLFEKIAKEESAGAKVEFTGVVPYFKPGTTEVVEPSPKK